MRPKCFFSLFAAILITGALRAQMPHDAGLVGPPKTEVNEVKEDFHGVEIVDPYRWLEDQNSPETRKWIGAENAYTDSLISKISGTDELARKVGALLKVETMSPPVMRNGRYFFTRRRADQDQSSLYAPRTFWQGRVAG